MAEEVYSWENLARGGGAECVAVKLEVERVSKKKLIADLCCGDNFQVQLLTEMGFNAVGLDYVEWGSRLTARDRFLFANVRECLPFGDTELGGVIGNNMLGLLEHGEVKGLLGEIRRCIGNGGFVFFPVWGKEEAQNLRIIRRALKGSGIRVF